MVGHFGLSNINARAKERTMVKIITHPGKAHRDDFISVCLVLNQFRSAGYMPMIERKEPSAEELANPAVWCIDVGRDHNMELNNFDHHQFPRDADPQCALSLVLDKLGLSSVARAASWEWLTFTEILDCKGPMVTAKHYGVTMDAMTAFLSPIEAQLLIQWEENPNDPGLLQLMACMGGQWVKYWESFGDRLKLLKEVCSMVPIDGTKGMLVVPVDRNDNPSFAVEKFCQMFNLDPSVVVSLDDRGNGWTLFRRNDDPSIDFSLVEDDGRITFAHANGFVAKTVEGLTRFDLIELVELASTAKQLAS